MKKVVILTCFLILLVGSVFALPPPPASPALPGSSSSTTPPASIPISTSNQTNVSSQPNITSTPSNNQINAVFNRLDNIDTELTSLKSQIQAKTEAPKPSSPIGYFIFLFILNLLVIAALVYLFLKNKTKKSSKIPESIKTYVKTNLQRGYPEFQIKQQLTGQGWSNKQINQIFGEIRHGL